MLAGEPPREGAKTRGQKPKVKSGWKKVGRFKRRFHPPLSANTGSFRAKACHQAVRKKADEKNNKDGLADQQILLGSH